MRKSIANYSIVTNADTGFGKELALSLAKRGNVVLITTLDETIGEKLVEEIRFKSRSKSVMYHVLDLSSQTSIRKFVADYRYNVKQLDFLIFNDSVEFLRTKKQRFSSDEIEKNWAEYHMGPVIMSGLLLALLKESSDGRILISLPESVFANRHLKVNLEDPELRNSKYNMMRSYHQAKLAEIFFIEYLAQHINETNIILNGITIPQLKIPKTHLKKTGLGVRLHNKFAKSPKRSKNTFMFALTCSRKRLITGSIMTLNKKNRRMNPYIKDVEIKDQVMTLTRKYIIS